jgi:hypothetical protein
MRRRTVLAIAGAAVLAPLVALAVLKAWPEQARNPCSEADPDRTYAYPARSSKRYAFPLKVSSDRRYLVDQDGVPFLIAGDSPQAMIGKLSVDESAAFVANRKSAGFNSLLVDLLCADYTGCRSDGTTFDGIEPFTTPGDLGTPNPAYFDRADAIIATMTKQSIAVFLDPIETGSWLEILRRNGVDAAYRYGQYVGRRYRDVPNLVWWSGNDFQTWKSKTDDAVVLAVANGIKSVDRSHLHTVLLDFLRSGSLDDGRWRPVIDLDAAYTYFATYAEVLKEYDRRPAVPVFMAEAGYEFEQNDTFISCGDPLVIRRQAYWSLLSGAAGQFYGNYWTWPFRNGWETHVDSPGSLYVAYLMQLFERKPWFRLVPDQAHRIVTGGYGSFEPYASVGSSDYVTTAGTPDGRLAMSYLPAGGTLTIDTTRLAGPATAQWFDPTSGTSTPGVSLPDRSAVTVTAPGANAEGDDDWVLVLTAG